MELNDKLKETFGNLKTRAEKLRVQINLGAKEAQDEFEIQKKNMQEWLDDNKLTSDNFKDMSSAQIEELKIMYEELQVQLALGRAEGEDAIKEQSKNIQKKIHDIKFKIDKDEQYQNLKTESYEKLDELNDMFFIFNKKFQYDLEDGKNLWEEKKNEIYKEIDSWNVELDEIKKESSEKLENFSDEISKAWNHFKKAF
jgi:phage-related minor tail protein